MWLVATILGNTALEFVGESLVKIPKENYSNHKLLELLSWKRFLWRPLVVLFK